MDLLIEITRSLYHLDLFRRSFRLISVHQCPNHGYAISAEPSVSQPLNNSINADICIVCSFKDIFNELNLSMRESVLDPPLIHKIIETKLKSHMQEIEAVNNAVQYKSLVKANHLLSYNRRNFISSNGNSSSVPPGSIYDYIFQRLEASLQKPNHPVDINALQHLEMSQWKDLSNLKTEYSLTKICLECRTTTHIESISQYIHQVDSSSLIANDWPSFEFGLKSALDSVEFCVKPNCHGQTKIFRCLRSFPEVLGLSFTDTSNVSTIHILPTNLRPCLVFESSTTTDVNLKSLVLHSPEWGYGSLFYHSRLEMWIFIDSRRILPLSKTWTESKFNPILNGFRAIVVFYCHDKDNSVCLPQSSLHSEQVPKPMPIIPPRVHNFNQIYANSSVLQCGKVDDDRIYENWPVDSDSGQGSNEESSSSCSYGINYNNNNEAFLMKPPQTHSHTNGQGLNLYRKPSTLSTNSTNSMLSSVDSRGIHNVSNSATLEGKSGGGSSSSKNKFATIRRKGKCSSGAASSKPDRNFSVSVPDLRLLTSPSTNCLPDSTMYMHQAKSEVNSSNGIYNKYTYGDLGDNEMGVESYVSCRTTKGIISSPKHDVFTSSYNNNNHSSISSGSSRSGIRTVRSSKNVIPGDLKLYDNGSLSSNKKVSFNCEVTLVNDQDDEYIPHPIFQSVINKLNKM